MRRKKVARRSKAVVATENPTISSTLTLATMMKKIDALAGANEIRFAMLEKHNEALLHVVQQYKAGIAS